jgi:TM2 domain-containing membrane protein YozV
VAGLVLGIVSIVFCWTFVFDLLLIVPALIFSLLGLGETRRGRSGRGMAVAGLWCTIVAGVLCLAFTILLVVVARSIDCSTYHDPNSFSGSYCRQRG